jgi:DNA-directed RNA polymerase specialized sigma24 family protein
MDALGSSYLGSLVTEEAALGREFELRLAESSTLAFRVAYSVLRNRADAEEVAQDALIRACRSLPSLRDRERLRSWLVGIVWRLALDLQRADRPSPGSFIGSGRKIHPQSAAGLLEPRRRPKRK